MEWALAARLSKESLLLQQQCKMQKRQKRWSGLLREREFSCALVHLNSNMEVFVLNIVNLLNCENIAFICLGIFLCGVYGD